MNPYQETARTWDKLAGIYRDKFMDLDIYNDSYNQLNGLLRAEARILDAGCGPGNISRFLSAHRPDLQVLGIDFAPDMIRIAREANPAGVFRVMDIRDIGMLESTFEAIICGFCLPYLLPADARRLITDCAALLAPGGYLYISFVAGDPEQSGYHSGSSGGRMLFHYYKAEALEAELQQAGLDPVYQSRINYKKGDDLMEVHSIIITQKI
jgi:SAM-dependent methyltransferase